MKLEDFFQLFATFAEAPNCVAKLREMILQFAVQGKLVSQDDTDEPALNLRAKILTKRKQLIEQGEFTAFPIDMDWQVNELPYPLPDSWEWIRLGDLGGFLGGGTPSKERTEFWDGQIPWVSPKDMKRPYMDDAIDHISQLGVENSSGRMIPKGALLMVVRGMILAHSFPVALTIRELTINQDMKALQLSLPEIGEYLLRCCAASKSRMLLTVERSSHGTCRLPTEAVANFPIPLPPLGEQRRIVEKVDQLLKLCDELAKRQTERTEARKRLVSSTLDRLVSSSSNADFPTHANRVRDQFDLLFDTPATISQLRQAILQLAVQGRIVPQDPNDEPVVELRKAISDERRKLWEAAEKAKFAASEKTPKDDSWQNKYEPARKIDLDIQQPIPPTWQWISFDEIIARFQYGPRFGVEEYVADGIPTVRTTDMDYRGNVALGDSPKVRIPSHAEVHWCLQSSDLLVTRTGATIGKCAIYDESWGRAIASAYLIRFRFTRQCVFPKFVLLFLMSPFGQSLLLSGATETAQPNVNATNISRFPFPIAPLAEQKRIVSKVNELMSLCDELEAKLTQSETSSTKLLSAAVHHLLTNASSA